jgi:hypothetical protein
MTLVIDSLAYAKGPDDCIRVTSLTSVNDSMAVVIDGLTAMNDSMAVANDSFEDAKAFWFSPQSVCQRASVPPA